MVTYDRSPSSSLFLSPLIGVRSQVSKGFKEGVRLKKGEVFVLKYQKPKRSFSFHRWICQILRWTRTTCVILGAGGCLNFTFKETFSRTFCHDIKIGIPFTTSITWLKIFLYKLTTCPTSFAATNRITGFCITRATLPICRTFFYWTADIAATRRTVCCTTDSCICT